MEAFAVFILLGAVVGFAIWFTKKQSVPNSHDKEVHNCFVLPIYRKHPSAHVLLLSKFLKSAQPIEYYQIGPIGIKDWAVSSWTNVLGEEPASTIRCFINQGLLEPTDLAGRLGWQYVVVELKDFLRERGLRVSGRKVDLVERLVKADLEGMEKIAGTTVAYRCSEKGREIAEQYLLERKDKEEKAREDTFNALEQREFQQAWQIMTSHNAQRVFSDGLMTDIQEFMGSCRAIFAYQPKMLASLNSKQIEQLRCLAAMSSFGWEEYPSYKWRPRNWLLPPRIPLPGTMTDLHSTTTLTAAERETLVNPTVAMLLFRRRGWIQSRLAQERQTGVKTVTILASSSACDACRALSDKSYDIDNVPIIPNENCTAREGCKCKVFPQRSGSSTVW